MGSIYGSNMILFLFFLSRCFLISSKSFLKFGEDQGKSLFPRIEEGWRNGKLVGKQTFSSRRPILTINEEAEGNWVDNCNHPFKKMR